MGQRDNEFNPLFPRRYAVPVRFIGLYRPRANPVSLVVNCECDDLKSAARYHIIGDTKLLLRHDFWLSRFASKAWKC